MAETLNTTLSPLPLSFFLSLLPTTPYKMRIGSHSSFIHLKGGGAPERAGETGIMGELRPHFH